MQDGATDQLVGYTPVALFRHDGIDHIEAQALLGLRRWADNFGHVHMMMPVEYGPPPANWTPMPDAGVQGVTLHIVPTAYRPDQFARALPATLPLIRALVERPAHRCFAIGGLFGDWGAVAATLAHRLGLPHAVWTDRIESQVIRRGALSGPWRQRVRKRLYHRPMAMLERVLIGRATVGLFNGQETFDHYAPMARAAEMVHDLSISRDDHIAPDALADKRARSADPVLRIVYTGRADPMKGPRDWVQTLAGLRARGVAFTATWLGDGPELGAMRAMIAAEGLDDAVTLAGFQSDRGAVMQAIRDAHVCLFCHRTPESPRCLIEALVSATPLVGYGGAYVRGLIGGTEAGRLRDIGDVAGLADDLAGIAADRQRLARMIDASQARGAGFDADTAFRHRAEVLRRHLGPPRGTGTV